MDILKTFADFLSRIILPRKTGYIDWINKSNVEQRLQVIKTVYQNSFGTDPFQIDLSQRNVVILAVQNNLRNKAGTTFEQFNLQARNGIPNAILNTYLVEFIQLYEPNVSFLKLQELVDNINSKLGNAFCTQFQQKRIEYNGNGRIASYSKLFGDVRDDYWTINIGSEREIQYHLNIDKERQIVKYGLGFNAQPSRNNTLPIPTVKPFIIAFFKDYKRIQNILSGYDFLDSSEQELRNIQLNDFICYGKQMAISKNPVDNRHQIDGLDFLEMLYDLRGKQFDAYKIIFSNSRTAEHMNFTNQHLVDLLEFKKQIILQGPPGTGKTKLAKELARELIGLPINVENNFEITDQDILDSLKGVSQLRTVAGKVEYHVINVDETTRKITVKRSTDTEAQTDFEKVKQFYKDRFWEQPMASNDDRRAAAIAQFIYYSLQTKSSLETSDQCKLIQFHPSYSYEDFVRGITAKPNEDGDGVLYEAENKLLGEFAKTANENYLASRGQVVKDNTFGNKLAKLTESIQDALEKDGKYPFGTKSTANIIGVKTDGFLYNFPKREEIKYKLLFSDLALIFKERDKISKPTDVDTLELNMKGKYPYYFMIYEKMNEIKCDSEMTTGQTIPKKNYVLIIDEINRANLSSVLGELIYALEYRNENVESIYSINKDNQIRLPPNLYIIGTMNTADRSVGHIDYAIRRRFAFVDVLPVVLQTNGEIIFHQELFRQVSGLFIKNLDAYLANQHVELERSDYLSQEFLPKDVWLGHSYFIQKKIKVGNIGNEAILPASINLRVQYEIIPILEEYVKDGVLIDNGDEKQADNQSVKAVIRRLKEGQWQTT